MIDTLAAMTPHGNTGTLSELAALASVVVLFWYFGNR
jgi:hypothetical protein